MRTNKIISIIVTVVIALQISSAQAQMSQYKFNQLFDRAFAQIVEGDLEGAMPILDKLYEADPEHGQVSFLLGMCEAKTGNISLKTEQVLVASAAHYNYTHQRGRVEDRTAPAKVWFYLAEVRAELGHIDEAVNAYRNYMSCIPLASLEHKRDVVQEIKRLKQRQLALASVGASGVIINSMP